jgi:hypothetical protein
MNNTDLKKGDVIVINWGDKKMLAIFEKFDTNTYIFSKQDVLFVYIEMNMSSKKLILKPTDCELYYELRDITYRLADENEKNTLYNAIGKNFEVEYDKYWYNHFTDSSYFDIQDYLFSVFKIEVREYDDDLIYPDFINEIHTYIWDKLCKAMNVTDTDVNKPEMVNKQEFIAKVKKWLELETNWGQEFDENGRNENYGKIDELIKYLEE